QGKLPTVIPTNEGVSLPKGEADEQEETHTMRKLHFSMDTHITPPTVVRTTTTGYRGDVRELTIKKCTDRLDSGSDGPSLARWSIAFAITLNQERLKIHLIEGRSDGMSPTRWSIESAVTPGTLRPIHDGTYVHQC
ncbi:hypothetical protein HAX54_020339, partial [Datura stramonium]|nr:hypothetical protein [Datura stramonium]